MSFNKRDKGSKLLSDAVREINRNKKGNRFAPGLKPGAAVRRALARGK